MKDGDRVWKYIVIIGSFAVLFLIGGFLYWYGYHNGYTEGLWHNENVHPSFIALDHNPSVYRGEVLAQYDGVTITSQRGVCPQYLIDGKYYYVHIIGQGEYNNTPYPTITIGESSYIVLGEAK